MCTRTFTHCTHSCDLTLFLSEVTSTMFLRPMRNAFYHVTRWWWWWWWWRWWRGGRQTAVSHQRYSQLQSASRKTLLGGSEGGQSTRVELKRNAGAKIPPIRRSSQFVLPHPRCSSGVSGLCLASVMNKSVARGEWVAAIWEWLCFFLIVSCLFTPTQL